MKKKILSLILMSTIIVSTSLTTLAIPASAATAPSKESSVSSGVNKISTK